MTVRTFLVGWDRFWLRKAPPHPIALLRIAFGAFLLLYWLLFLPHVPQIFSRAGLVLPLITGGPLAFLLPPTSQVAWMLYAILIAALVCFTVGMCTRTAAFIALLLYAGAWILTLHLLGASFDRIFMFALLVFACSPAGNAFSVTMWRRHGSIWAWEEGSICAQRVLAVQLSATYLGVGLQKAWLPDWQSGEILAQGYTGRWATPLAYWLIRLNWPLWTYDLQVTAVKVGEFLLPFALWHRKTRWWAFAWGALFHIIIALTLAIWWFLALIPCYIVYFSPEEVLHWLHRVSKGRVTLTPSSPLHNYC